MNLINQTEPLKNYITHINQTNLNLKNQKNINMKNLIITIALLIIVHFSFAQVHVVKPNGNTGIGTKYPQAKLDVNGHTHIGGGLLTIGQNGAGLSKIAIGENRTINGKSFVDLKVMPNQDFVGRMISGVNADGTTYTSLMHKGSGDFSIRMWNPASKMVFRNPKGDWLTIDTEGTIIAGGEAKKPGGGEWATTSDKRTKKNIHTYEAGLEEVLKLNPITYNYNGKAGITDTEKDHVGLIAQEFAKVAPYAVNSFSYIEEGSNKTEEYLSMDATSVKYMLVNAVKEQQALIDAQQQLAKTQQVEIENLKAQMTELKANRITSANPKANEINVLLEGTGVENALLAQNTPNPFVTNTRIEYFIPKNSRHCRMSFRDMNGKEIKQVNIEHEGIGAIELSAKDLAAGIYSYVLYVNGDIVASKKMILKQ